MKKILLVLSFLVSLNVYAGEEVTVGVNGMVCAFCAQGIEKTFMEQKEVAKIEVSLANKYVKIKFKDGQKLSNDKIASLLKDAGYEANFENTK